MGEEGEGKGLLEGGVTVEGMIFTPKPNLATHTIGVAYARTHASDTCMRVHACTLQAGCN